MGSKSGGEGEGTSSSINVQEPWVGQQPYLTDAFTRARQAVDSGGPAFPDFATYNPFSPQTESAMGLQWNRALSGSPLIDSAKNEIQNTMTGGYLNANPWLNSPEFAGFTGGMQNPGVSELRSTYGARNPGINQIQGGTTPGVSQIQGGTNAGIGQIRGGYNAGIPGIERQASRSNAALGDLQPLLGAMNPILMSRGLQDTMAGNYVNPDSNPYLQQYFDKALQSALPSVNATFSMAGRTGAPAHTQAVGDTMGALGRDIYGQAYDQERARQMSALGMGAGLFADDMNRNLSAVGMGAGIRADDMNRQLGALTTGAGLRADDLSRNLSAAGMRAGLMGDDLNRNLSAATTRAGFGAADLDRGMSAAGMRAGLYGDDYNRRLQAMGMASGLRADDYNRQLSALGMGASDYGTERSRQMQSQLFAPQLAQQDYADIQNAMQIGQMTDQKAQQALDDRIQRFQWGQMAPERALDSYLSRIGGMQYGGTSTSTGSQTYPEYGSLGGQMLGGALTGASIAPWLTGDSASSLFSSGGMFPWALGGALLGGLV